MAVLNDFEAAGYGITIITEKDYVVLNDVPAVPQASFSISIISITTMRTTMIKALTVTITTAMTMTMIF